MMSDQQSFRDFLADLTAEFGPDLLGVRHEVYFTARRRGQWQPKVLQGVRALAALALTIFDLMIRPGPRRIEGEVDGFLVASLPGENGWQGLRPLLNQAQATQMKVAALWHPRLGRRDVKKEVAVYWLPRPVLKDFWNAIAQALPYLRRKHPTVGSLAAAAIFVRGQLWRAAWRRLAKSHPVALALHNDFDLMGASAVESGLPAMLIQHGTPTDEFFPIRAGVVAAWGRLSAQVLASGLSPDQQMLEDGMGRLERAAPSMLESPDEIILLSQTHTDLYGSALKGKLIDLAERLEALQLPHTVWLHPAEGAAPGPYRRALAAPHPELTRVGNAPKLVIGFSSTALIDAALAGHYVLGLDGDFPGSRAAQAVSRPPVRIADAEALAVLWSELQSSHEGRIRLDRSRRAWIEESFAPTGAALAEWVRMAARCSRS